MNGERGLAETTDDEATAGGPACPFCGERWSRSMLDALDAATVHRGCACRAAAPPRQDNAAADPAPSHDILCESCGRALFRAMTTHGTRDTP